ncbi:hypothetical protein NW768_004051 [Fusarium equiseti]|uniref:Uncharacterized protein n=1 Tax=Fusarium equiseti TaxID=61235 RepID=A0ABQ8RJG4_FUSEQ|nr:hypothetical protein NW768_004051 [Fusarium equiseti]
MEEVGVQKRKRGRPRKAEATEPARRGRGRPPKKQKLEVILLEDSGSEWSDGDEKSPERDSAVHRGLGRLPNTPQNALHVPEGGEESCSEGMEAAPTGEISLRAEVNVPRGRGRPRRTSHNAPPAQRQEQEDDAEETEGAPSGVPRADHGGSPLFEMTARRRRGRPRKATEYEVGGSHRPRTRNSTRVQRQDMEAEVDDADDYEPGGSNGFRRQQQAEESWEPEGRIEAAVIAELREACSQRVEYARKRNKARPPITRKRIDAADSFFYKSKAQDSELWSEDDEEQLRKTWLERPELTALGRLFNYGSHQTNVFKLSFELFKIDPLSLLSLFRECGYDNSETDVIMHQGSAVANPIWSQTFCDKLLLIMAHPFFRPWGASRLIPLTICWAVMLRWHSRASFNLEEIKTLDYAGCPNLGRLDDGVPRTRLIERFKSGQKRLREAGLFLSPCAELFMTVHKVVGNMDQDEKFDRLKVKTSDLTNVINALDSLNPMGMAVTCEAHLQMWRAGRVGRGYPAGLDERKEAYEVAWKDMFRKARVAEREDRADEDRLSSAGVDPEGAVNISDGTPPTESQDSPFRDPVQDVVATEDPESPINSQDSDSWEGFDDGHAPVIGDDGTSYSEESISRSGAVDDDLMVGIERGNVSPEEAERNATPLSDKFDDPSLTLGFPPLSLEAMDTDTDGILEQGPINANLLSSDNPRSDSRQASSSERRRAGENPASPMSEELDWDDWQLHLK